MTPEPLPREFFAVPVERVAHGLLGQTLVSVRDGITVVGRIVETEAYGDASDPASHAGRLRHGALRMDGEPGIAYVCRAYGIHSTLNVVAEPIGRAAAVLIRAVEPLDVVAAMAARRAGAGPLRNERLCAGPGNLCRAFAIALVDDGRDLTSDGTLYLVPGAPIEEIHCSPRVGITRGLDRLWRFFDPTSAAVSASRRGVPVADRQMT